MRLTIEEIVQGGGFSNVGAIMLDKIERGDNGMTLSEIRVLLWHHYSPAPYPEDNSNIGAAYSNLISLGLLESEELGTQKMRTTERGAVYIEALRAVPLPVQKWVMP